MNEELLGIGVSVNDTHFILAFSMNVFTFGLEFYPGSFVVRFGPIAVGVNW